MSGEGDFVRYCAILKENVDRENLARRNYPLKWGILSAKDLNKFYNQNEVSKEIVESDYKEQCPYLYTGHGDSYFVSKDMYNALLAVCRCGRPKSNVHIVKCLQKLRSDYINSSLLDSTSSSCKDNSEARKVVIPRIPETTTGTIGWLPNRYAEWDRTTRYISPRYTMPGYKVDEHPYSNIFIGMLACG